MNHKILVDKFEKLGLSSPVLRWITRLLNTIQSVRDNGITSRDIFVSSGVPQSHIAD